MKPWHERDSFWVNWAPVLFHEQRLKHTPADVDSIVALLGLKPGASVLDLCCGPGRHALELARRGFQVVGVDRTRAYLRAAERSARKEKLDIEFVRRDARRFCRPRAFDAVINLFTSFGYFRDPEDDAKVLRNVRRSLKKGGLLLIDTIGKEVIAKNFRERDWEKIGPITVLQEREVCESWSWMVSRWTMFRGGKTRRHTISHRIYSAAELIDLGRGCGFTLAGAYGSLDGAPYDHTAKRLIVVFSSRR
ncbi:MAG: class I SAM-dependent methyltransferase [Planctomycetota bacterium]|nr:class I SAM-dependent methyltransferase [Planctomycetota bacterium]